MKRVLVILPHAFKVYEAAALIDVLGWANHYGNAPIETVTAGISEEISCTFGSLRVKPQVMLKDVLADEFDAVAIPGGFGVHGFYEEAYSDVVLRTIRDFDRDNKPVASICVGALPVGKSGILRGKRATTYQLMGSERTDQLAEFGALVVDAPLVIDENRISSASPATAIDVALTLVAKLTTSENADRIRQLMGFGANLPEGRVKAGDA